MTPIVILVTAVLLQLAAAVLAIRLIWVTGVSRAWILLSLAILAMVVRRSLSLYGFWTGDAAETGDWTFEFIGLAISLLILAGIASIAPLFYSVRRSQETFRESQRQLTTLLHNLPGMAYRCRNDEARTMEFVSEGGLALTGYPPKDLLEGGAHPYLELIHPDDREAVRQRMSHALSQRRRHRLAYRILAADGTEKWVWEQGFGVFSEQGDAVAIEGFVTDVTEKKRADERSEHLNAVLRAIRNVNQVIARERDRDRLLQSICDSLVETRGYRYAWIVLLDEAGQPRGSAQAGVGEEFAALLQRLERKQSVACIQHALTHDGVFVVEDRQAVCGGCDVHVRVSGQTPIVVRLAWGEKTYGVMMASLPAEYARDAEEQELLAEVTGDIAFALHNLEVEQDRRRAEESLRLEQSRLEGLLQLSHMTEASLQEITHFALEEAVRLTQSKIGYLAFTTEDESVLTMHAWSKTAMQQCAIIDKPIVYPVATTGLWGEAVRQRRAVITNDYPAPSPLKKGYPAGHVPVARHMNVPIFEGQQIVAVIGVGNKEQPYDESDVRQLTLLGQGMWRLIQRRNVQEELRQARDELEVRVRVRTAELANANDELQQERYLLHSLMDNLPHNVYFKDADSRFIRINAAMARAFGLQDPAQAIAGSDRDFFTSEHASQALADEREIIRSGRPVIDKEEKETWPDGHVSWASTTKMPLYDEAGCIVGSFGISRDITEQKLAAEALRAAKEAAEAASRAKSTFLANMSHEIRTPMNAIIGMGRQLHRTILNDQQQFYLETINKAAEHLLVLINDILDISKIEAGKLNLEQIGFRPDEVIDHCIQVMEHKAEEKGLKLMKENSPEKSTIFLGDPYRLTQILLNLLSNAIKFTEEGNVTISCLLQPVINDRQLIILSVKDTGIGMDGEFLSSIFRKFTQEEQSTARKYGGTGLGMSISKQLTELMNGHIEVSSKKGEGTTITLTIPFSVGTEKDIPQTKGKVIDSSILKEKKILLVEDNEMNRLVATTLLENYGVNIAEVHDGAEAVRALKTGYYDLVLMDVQMPVLNGLDATRIIRQEVNQFVPIIALTANAIKGEAEKCLKAGMNDYISKPFEEEELINAIARWLGEEPESFTTLQPSAMENKPAIPLYDLKKLEQIAQNNQPFVLKMVTLFSRQAPADVHEIEMAFEKQDYHTVRSVAHRMKPSIDNMGILSLHDLIREIELFNQTEKTTDQLENRIRELRDTITQVVDLLQKEVLI